MSSGVGPVAIDDPADPRLDAYRALRERGQRRDPERFLVESELAVVRLLESPHPAESVLATPARAGRLAALAPAGVPVYLLEPELLRAVTGFDYHRGVVAAARRPDLGRLPREAVVGKARTTTVVAQGLADPVNVGAIARCAAAFGADLLVCDAAAADPLAPRALRAGMAHQLRLPLAVVHDLPGALRELRQDLGPGARVLAASLAPAATPLQQVARPEHLVLLLGNEGDGLSPELLAAADEQVTIPMAAGVDSLNVAAAAAVLLYALR